MKIALAQINSLIGDFENNSKNIIRFIEKAREGGAELVAFPELSVCGYPSRDFLEFDDFINKCLREVNNIAQHCVNIAAIIGCPDYNKKGSGKRIYNAAFFLSNGEIQSVHHKALLPTYDIFDEYRYFEPANEFQVITINNTRIAITICEDIWNQTDQPMYSVQPMDILSKQKPDILINIAASPFDYTHDKQRVEVLKRNALKYNLPVYYVNYSGSQTELIFDGGSLAMNRKGELLKRLEFFKEDLLIIDSDSNQKEDIKSVDEIALIHDALICGIKDYFKKLGLKRAVLGMSGGIDSALTLALAVEALGGKNVLAVLMPSQYSSDHSVNDALEMISRVGCPYKKINIDRLFNTYLEELKLHFENQIFDITEENLQARIRSVLLMGLANKNKLILLNTSNKSEMAVGYGTLYGDLSGGLSIIGDLYKTRVYKLTEYLNRNEEIIPENIIRKAPSAELKHDQRDSDTLPDYSILDKILFDYIELQKSPDVINCSDRQLVKKIISMVDANEYKRHQTPPVLRVSPKAFGMGRRMPIVARYQS